jgi:GNAT superfamily N-acetyltransferase
MTAATRTPRAKSRYTEKGESMPLRGPDGLDPTREIEVGDQRFSVQRAQVDDLPALVALLTDDPLGRDRETGDLSVYETAFRAIDDDPNQFLATVRDQNGDVVGTMQLTLIPGLSRGATTRIQIEAVRIARSARGTGLGTAMFEWAHEYGRLRGAALAQLTTDKTRTDAHRFYARLGYEASHEGLKRSL